MEHKLYIGIHLIYHILYIGTIGYLLEFATFTLFSVICTSAKSWVVHSFGVTTPHILLSIRLIECPSNVCTLLHILQLHISILQIELYVGKRMRNIIRHPLYDLNLRSTSLASHSRARIQIQIMMVKWRNNADVTNVACGFQQYFVRSFTHQAS